MLNPYTMAKLNAERLKDLDREAAGLHFSRLARRNRQAALKAVRLRLGDLLITVGDRIKHSVDQNTRLLNGPVHKNHWGMRR
jgi:hypothetical protein